MVTDWIVRVGSWVIGWFAGLISLPDVPAWVESAPDRVQTVGSYVGGLGAWIPWVVVAGVLGTWVVVLAASVAVKLIRIAVAHIPFVGGSPG